MIQSSAQDQFTAFRAVSSVVLGGMAGALIGFPAATAAQSPLSQIIAVAATVFGFAVGYRRRNSHAFFYFVLVAVCLLAGLLAFSGFQPGSTASQ